MFVGGLVTLLLNHSEHVVVFVMFVFFGGVFLLSVFPTIKKWK